VLKRNQNFLINTDITKLSIIYSNVLFFVRCMTYFKKLSKFEIDWLIFEYKPLPDEIS